MAEDLIGVPENMITDLERGTDTNKGKVRLTFSFPRLFTTMKYATNSETRRLYFTAYENRCPANVAVFQEITVLRQETAQLLGHANHAALRIRDKMAKTPETVMSFLNDLRSRLSSGAQDDMERLRQLKNANLKARGKAADKRFYLWDYAFYNRQMLETQYSVNRQEIADTLR